jgi:hypothetical protein
MTDSPITPPPLELVLQWIGEHFDCTAGGELSDLELFLTVRAAQWGADQELEACCEWLEQQTLCGHQDLLPSFRAARRPKPPSLKEQALQALNDAVKMADDAPPEGICSDQADIIRRALEQLP